VSPAFVTQLTVAPVVGISPRDFMRLAREGKFPSTKEHRRIVARTADVLAYIEERLAARATPVADESVALARAGLRRVS
jgi:hypothetical protein